MEEAEDTGRVNKIAGLIGLRPKLAGRNQTEQAASQVQLDLESRGSALPGLFRTEVWKVRSAKHNSSILDH